MSENANQKKNFKDTLNLPHTNFPIRANYKEEDAQLLERWEKESLYQKSFNHNKGEKKFILHDGPPYANGHLHSGHAYNKILKDVVCKSQRMMGKQVPVIPGWDCHGLPIEFAVKKENPTLTGSALKKACREYANKWITIQKYEFKQLGVLMNWDQPYLTMDFTYEAAILEAFSVFVEAGYIERKNKTVPWCPSCQTVLAAAEIEYHDRKDPSLYVLFALNDDTQLRILPQLQNKPVSLLVWTTTPWTIPLNRAILLKPDTDYVVCETEHAYVVIGKTLADKVASTCGFEKNILAEINSQQFAREKAIHPLSHMQVPILLDDSVLLDDGTACVHSAPGAGPIDYEVGIKNNLEIYSPITPNGHYTADIKPGELAGMSVADGQGWVITQLLNNNKLLFKSSIKHSYPHCWRCRGGLIFRATKQWFCDLSHNNLKDKAAQKIKIISMIPQGSHNRFEATLEGRLEWCLSRQREWGVPIPALLCLECDHAFTNKQFIAGIAQHIQHHGIEYWDTVLLESILPKNISCTKCGSKKFRKETDILDVWFESGISHYAVLLKNPDLSYPADIYLEGKDQHRAWFQSSLLTSMILEEKPCMRSIVTHGFTVDEHGRKMSKSLGNVVSPQEMVERLGTDGLRLWAASIDITGDAIVSDILLKNVQEVLRKIRNTCRFLLSNINDFDFKRDEVPLEKMQTIDKYALQELFELYEEIIYSYKEYNFTRIFHLLGTYCAVNLSAFYLDIIKDRLYVEKKDGRLRRSAQTVCFVILDTLTKLMAPILSFTAEQLSDHYQKDKIESIHLQQFPTLPYVWRQLVRSTSPNDLMHIYGGGMETTKLTIEMNEIVRRYEESWMILKEIRSALLKAIEIEREKQLIKHSLEAHVTLYIDQNAEYASLINKFFINLNKEMAADFFKEFLIVSQVVIAINPDGLVTTIMPGLLAQVKHADGVKCPRCWQWSVTNHSDHLCDRCAVIV
jgi:isoleucyl-tRNA synthetase